MKIYLLNRIAYRFEGDKLVKVASDDQHELAKSRAFLLGEGYLTGGGDNDLYPSDLLLQSVKQFDKAKKNPEFVHHIKKLHNGLIKHQSSWLKKTFEDHNNIDEFDTHTHAHPLYEGSIEGFYPHAVTHFLKKHYGFEDSTSARKAHAAIQHWSNGSGLIRNFMKGNSSPSEDVKAKTNHLHNFIQKAPSYSLPKGRYLFRGVHFGKEKNPEQENQNFLSQLKKSGGYKSSAFASWTDDGSIAKGFLAHPSQSSSILYVQDTNKNGKSIAPLSTIRDEKEILMPPTSHKLVKMGKIGDFDFRDQFSPEHHNTPVALMEESNSDFSLKKSTDNSNDRTDYDTLGRKHAQRKLGRKHRFVVASDEIEYKDGKIIM